MKNIHLLTFNGMINISGHWLSDAELGSVLDAAGPLGVGLRKALVEAHEPLVALRGARAAALERLEQLVLLARRLDDRHDRHGRALHFALRAHADAASSEQQAHNFRALLSSLYPEGLRGLRLPYAEEGGASMILRSTINEEIRAKLAEVALGSRTLDDLFVAWTDAGMELGKAVAQRAELEAELSSEGKVARGLDLRTARARWLNAVRGLLWGIDTQAELEPLRERVYGVLSAAVSARVGGGVKKGEDGIEEIEELDEFGELDEPGGPDEMNEPELIAS